MSYRYPYGNTEQMNLDWFLNQWEKFKADWAEAEAGIDGSLDAEIAKVEAAMSELYAARDAAAASASAARQNSLDAAAAQIAAGNSKTAAQAAETSARGSQQAAAQSAQEAQASAQGAENSALTASQAANTATQQAAGADAARGAAEAAQQAAEDAQAAAAQSAGQAGQAATAAADHADDASDSATLAQQAAQDMSDSVEQITTNKNDISDLKESIESIVNTKNVVLHQFDTYTTTNSNDYLWIAKTIPIPAHSQAIVKFRTNALSNGTYIFSLLKKENDGRYTIVKEYTGSTISSVKIDTYTVYTYDNELYVGWVSPNGALSFRSSNTTNADILCRALYSDFTEGDGTAEVSDVSLPIKYSYSLEVVYTGVVPSPPSFTKTVIVDKNGSGNFTSIQTAITNTQEDDTIIIFPGTYYESVEMWGKKRHLIGLSKENCIIYSGNGLYETPALEANIGSIENLTIISGNDNSLTEESEIAKAYALHIERENSTPYEFIAKNCTFISYLHASVGIGCRYNQTITFDNCTFETKASRVYSNYYNTMIDAGALLFHNDASSTSSTGTGKLIINNCVIKGITKAIMAQSIENNKEMTVLFNKCLAYIANNGVSNVVGFWGNAGKGVSPYFCGTDIILDSLSYGNNSNEIDFANYWN